MVAVYAREIPRMQAGVAASHLGRSKYLGHSGGREQERRRRRS